MSRSEELALEFEQSNGELVAYLRGLDAQQWLTPGVNSPIIKVGDEDEHRPIGTIAHHVANSHQRTLSTLGHMVAGQTAPRPEPGSAARHAAENPAPDQAETIQLLEERAAQVAAAIRALTDEQLDLETVSMMGPTTVGGFVKRAVVFHPAWHLSSIRAALEPAG
jgi:DinB superfamily